MIIVDVLLSFLLQIAFTIGVIVVFGLLIALCNRKFYANLGMFGRAACYITGCIGTPVHELSHALFCLIFAHKITEIRLFQIDSEDGTLGYVKHSYNSKNIYQRIGNFFIGIAPIIVISALLLLLSWLLIPDFVSEMFGLSSTLSGADFAEAAGIIAGIVEAFFSRASSWQWWVLLIVGMFLALHMTLSRADIRGALGGLLFLLAVFLIADIVIGIIGGGLLTKVTLGFISVGSFLTCVLLLSLMISVIAVAISFAVLKLLRKKIGV